MKLMQNETVRQVNMGVSEKLKSGAPYIIIVFQFILNI
jgi:hypothetical protein